MIRITKSASPARAQSRREQVDEFGWIGAHGGVDEAQCGKEQDSKAGFG